MSLPRDEELKEIYLLGQVLVNISIDLCMGALHWQFLQGGLMEFKTCGPEFLFRNCRNSSHHIGCVHGIKMVDNMRQSDQRGPCK